MNKLIRNKAKELVSQMTLEEKTSLCSGADTWHTQNIDRLGLESIMVADGPHGLRKQINTQDNLGVGISVKATCFPTASLTACSFDENLIYKMGQAIAEECIAEDVSVILGPGINIKRSPLCGRNFEYFSEDPLVAGKIGAAYVKGVQSRGIGTSLKHFAVNNQERKRMSISAEIDERNLRETYLRPFEIVVKDANPYTIMCSYNKINNIYSSENAKLLTKILREEWGYNGLVMSDWGAVNVRSDGVKAGLDLEMPGNGGLNDAKIIEAVNNGKLNVNDLNRVCENVVYLVMKCKETLTEKNYTNSVNNNISKQTMLDSHHNLAVKIAEESMVLLKNNNDILPINNIIDKKIALIGSLAKSPRYQGAGSSKINPVSLEIPYDIFKNNTNFVSYADGYTLNDSNSINKDKALLDEAIKIASENEYVIVFAGLPERYESEGFDRDNMKMPDNQNILISELCKVNNNIIVVLLGGSPIEIPWADNVSAILLGYLGGEGLGNAIYNIISGNTCPSGKLAETWPYKHTDSICDKYFPGDRLTVQYREGIFVGYKYYNTVNKPVRYPFGYGLSYSKFAYNSIKSDVSDITISTVEDINKDFYITVNVENIGNYDAKETILIFAAKKESNIIRPKLNLIGFKKVSVKSKEKIDVDINIKLENLAFYDTESNRFDVEDGDYIIYAAKNVNELLGSCEINITNNFDKKITKLNDSDYLNISQGKDIDYISDKSFEELLGHKISLPAKEPRRPFTMDNCLEDASVTFIGKMFLKIASKMITSEVEGKEKDQDQMMVAVIKEMPFHSLWVSSNGMITEKMMYAILDLFNGKLLRGIFKMITSR